MSEDYIDEKVAEVKEEVAELIRKEFAPIIENVFNAKYTGQYKLDEEQPCPEIREMFGEVTSLIETHINSMKELGVSPAQFLLYVVLCQSQFAMLNAVIGMFSAVDGLEQKTTGSDDE